MKSKRRRSILLTLLILAVLIGLPVWLVYRQMRQERLNRELIAAIEQENTAAGLALLKAGADANAEDYGNVSISARQVLRDWWDRLRNRKTAASAPFHPSALILAVDGGSVKGKSYVVLSMPSYNSTLAQALLHQGSDPNVKDPSGTTALMYAAQAEDAATVRLLLDRGARVNATNDLGTTALMLAYSDQPTGIIELLLDRGADIHARDSEGQTPLMCACIFGCYRQGLERMLAAGANINAVDKNGLTALMIAADNSSKAVGFLLAHGADVNARDSAGQTALMHAIPVENTDAVRLLLHSGADVAVKDNFGDTALSLANDNGFPDCVRLLRQAGAKR